MLSITDIQINKTGQSSCYQSVISTIIAKNNQLSFIGGLQEPVLCVSRDCYT